MLNERYVEAHQALEREIAYVPMYDVLLLFIDPNLQPFSCTASDGGWNNSKPGL